MNLSYNVLFSELTGEKTSKRNIIVAHCWLLVKFFLSNVVLLTADIITDIQTAQSFFEAEDYYWGLLSYLFIFAPFGYAVIIFLTSRCISSVKKYEIVEEKENIKNIVWQFPLLHPIK
jgi:hypothetical protein